MAQPESHQNFQTGHLGDTSNIGSVQGAYLSNQKGFWHETNFNRKGMKPILTEGQLKISSLRLVITRNYSRRKKLWILQTGSFPVVQLRVSAIRSGFQRIHEPIFSRNIHGIQDECLSFQESLKSEELVKG